MEQPKNTTDAKIAGAGTAAMVPEGTCSQQKSSTATMTVDEAAANANNEY